MLSDRTTGIRASVHDVEMELLLAVVLVVLVIFFFLHSLRATIIAGLAVPISLIGTCGVTYLLGFCLNNLSLMALTIATGFVVDDAIVMLENISPPHRGRRAAVRGGAERRQADRLHDHIADRLAARGADPAAVHGRRGGPPVPRVRHHAGHHHPDLGGGVPDADADDGRALDAHRRGRQARHLRREDPEVVRQGGRALRPRADLGARPPEGDPDRRRRHLRCSPSCSTS